MGEKFKLGKDHIAEQEVQLLVKESIPGQIRMIDNEFDKQLRAFKNKNTYKERFRRCGLVNTYGIEIFLFKPKQDSDSPILIATGGKVKSTSDEIVPTNIAKIIRVGEGLEEGRYKEGDLVNLPYAMVTGFTPNPKHAMYHQLDDSNYKPLIDEVLSPNVYTFVATLGQHAWLPPQEFDVEDENITTYAVYPDLIIGPYKY